MSGNQQCLHHDVSVNVDADRLLRHLKILLHSTFPTQHMSMDVIFHFSRAVSIMSFADSVIIDFVLIIQVAFGLNTVLASWCSPHEFPD